MDDRICELKDKFITLVENQMDNLAEINAKEMGEVIDIIKDLAETSYYCKIIEAMDEETLAKFGTNTYDNRMYYTNMTKHDVNHILKDIEDLTDNEFAELKEKIINM